MQVGDLVRYKKDDGSVDECDGLIGIVVHTEQDGYAVEIEWNDGERHVYFGVESLRYLAVASRKSDRKCPTLTLPNEI